LPIFIDNLYATLKAPIRIHTTEEMIGILERDVFNGYVYPRFSQLSNDYGPVIRKTVAEELHALGMLNLSVMEPGRTYTW
jgi:hypothetical protein